MNRGFTLLEMTVTIGITMIISSLILANFPQFSRRLELSRTAQAVALSFRAAEAAALGVREFAGVFPPYGLHFDGGGEGDIGQKSYILFADLNDTNADGLPDGNGIYDPVPVNDQNEQVDTYTISGIPRIVNLCVGKKSNGIGSGCGLGSLDIVFKRPNPDVFIRANRVIVSPGSSDFSDAEIIIRLPTGECKQVVIWTTGQLSIEPLESLDPLCNA